MQQDLEMFVKHVWPRSIMRTALTLNLDLWPTDPAYRKVCSRLSTYMYQVLNFGGKALSVARGEGDRYTDRQTSQIGTYGVTKNNPSGNFLMIYWIQTQYILLLGEQVLTLFLCIKRVRLHWNFIVNNVQSASYSSHGAPCPARDLFPWLNTRVKVHIHVCPWTIREYPKRHFRYLSDSGDTFLPLDMHLQGFGYMCDNSWLSTFPTISCSTATPLIQLFAVNYLQWFNHSTWGYLVAFLFLERYAIIIYYRMSWEIF